MPTVLAVKKLRFRILALGSHAGRSTIARSLTIFLLAAFSIFSYAGSVKESLEYVTRSPEYVDLATLDNVKLDLRYASTNNFVGKNMYQNFSKAFLHRDAFNKFSKASEALKKSHPDYKFLIFDALRPRSVQYILWDKVKGTDKEIYVANPEGGSIHNYGFALDLSIIDKQERELDMGTPFDDFTQLSQPALEEDFFSDGKLSPSQIANRKLLRKLMTDAGFAQLPHEWWHFDALSRSTVKSKYKIVD